MVVEVRALPGHVCVLVQDISLCFKLALVHLPLCLLHHFLVKFVDILEESLSIDRFSVFARPDLIKFRFHTAYFEFKFTDIFGNVLVSCLGVVSRIAEVLGYGLRWSFSQLCLFFLAQLGDVV